ncbi:uncharacterized protein LOC144533619 isoform X2 [Sander vitreus]
MFLAEAGCAYIIFILYISGVHGRANSICALKGSSVDLPCSAQRPTTTMKWYTVHRNGSTFVQKELSADGNHVTYNMSAESNFTLTIKDLRESDANVYCCGETSDNPELCWHNKTELHVADLQVKVIPATEGQTMTLMCSTSCPLTENPAVYIWYKNREFLYQDSPWYQQLVSSEKGVRYSCAIKGYEDLRAPQVSVEVKVERTATSLTCTPCCFTTYLEHDYKWYQNRTLYSEGQTLSVSQSDESFSCAVKGLLSPGVCIKDKNCWSVNYVRRTICALEGSSVNISSEYTFPKNSRPTSKIWYKKSSGNQEKEELSQVAGRVEYHDKNNHHILTINNLKKNDSAEYTFRLGRKKKKWKESDFPAVMLVVTGLKLKVDAAVVIEGGNVTLTCSTSCPPPDSTTYTWYFNSHPLVQPNNTKILKINQISSQDAGKYSCAVKSGTQNITSGEITLTVPSTQTASEAAAAVAVAAAAAAGVCAVLLAITLLVVFFWIRKQRASGQSPKAEATDNTEQLNPCPVYENILARPAEQEELHYSRVYFSKSQAEPLYSTIHPHQPNRQDRYN